MASASKKRAKRPFPHEVDPSELEKEYPKKRKRARRSRDKAQSILDNIVRTDTAPLGISPRQQDEWDKHHSGMANIWPEKNPNQLELFDVLNSPNYGG